MKKIVFKEERQTIVNVSSIKPSDHIGFITTEYEKGYIVYVGSLIDGLPAFSAISIESPTGIACNGSFGLLTNNNSNSIEYLLDLTNRSYRSLREAYIFPTRKALYKWLSED